MIGIITDSTCDIPEELLQKYGIIVVPSYILWGNDQYRDRIDLQPKEFYRRLLADPQQPHSSMPSVQDFQAAFALAIQHGAERLIVLTVSSAMSGTYQQAKIAAEQAKVPITVIDAKGPTMSLGWQVLAAARAVSAGADFKAVVEVIDRAREKMVQFVGMESLKWLQTGGRIGNAVKYAGTVLQIKPLVSINHKTGLVEPAGIARTHRALVDLLCRRFFEQIGNSQHLRVAVLHGDRPEEAYELAEQIQVEHCPLEVLVNITGPVLGINTGPGALALCGYLDDEPGTD